MVTNQKKSTQATSAAKRERRERVPLTGHHNRRLTIPRHMEEDPDWRYYWFNDVSDRIQRALAAGYEFVDSKDMGRQNVGDPGLHNENSSTDSRVSKRLRDFTVYLMRIPMEYYLEDVAAKDKLADRKDEAINEGGASKVPHSYGLDVKYNPKSDMR